MELGTRLLTGSDGQRWQFDAGSLCLELLLTGGPGPYQQYESLRTPVDVVNWVLESRLARRVPIYPERVQVRPSELRRIKELRDTLWQVAVAVARGGRPEPQRLELINECAGSTARLELDPITGERLWAPMTGADLLGSLAGDAIDVIGGDPERLRECQGVNCSLLFLDTSRPGNRRWCSMQRCGNRQKVRAYRTRATSAERAV